MAYGCFWISTSACIPASNPSDIEQVDVAATAAVAEMDTIYKWLHQRPDKRHPAGGGSRGNLPIQLAAFEVLLPYRTGFVGDLPQRLKAVGVVAQLESAGDLFGDVT